MAIIIRFTSSFYLTHTHSIFFSLSLSLLAFAHHSKLFFWIISDSNFRLLKIFSNSEIRIICTGINICMYILCTPKCIFIFVRWNVAFCDIAAKPKIWLLRSKRAIEWNSRMRFISIRMLWAMYGMANHRNPIRALMKL